MNVILRKPLCKNTAGESLLGGACCTGRNMQFSLMSGVWLGCVGVIPCCVR